MEPSWSNSAILGELGRRLRRERLNRNMTQQGLADNSGLSRSTVAKVEDGDNFSMETLIRMLRTFELVDRLDALLPEPPLSPLQLARLKGKERQRASGNRSRERGK